MKPVQRLTSLLLIFGLLEAASFAEGIQITQDSISTTVQTMVVLDLGEEPSTYMVVIPAQTKFNSAGVQEIETFEFRIGSEIAE